MTTTTRDAASPAARDAGASTRPLLSLPAEDLATCRPTTSLFRDLLAEIAAPQTRWTPRLAERLDYAYSEMLARAVASGRTAALGRLGVHLGGVLAVRRDDLTRGDAPWFDRWHLLLELAERRVVWRTQLDDVLRSPPLDEIAAVLLRGPAARTALAAELGLEARRLSDALSVLERWELVRTRRDPRGPDPTVQLTRLGRAIARAMTIPAARESDDGR